MKLDGCFLLHTLILKETILNNTSNVPTVLTDEIMFNSARTIAKKHYYKWKNEYNGLLYDDLEGEVMEWVAQKRQQGLQKFADEGYYHYLGWMNKGVGRMLARWCQEELVRSRMFVALGSLDVESETGKLKQLLPVGLTYYIVRESLIDGNESMLALAEKSCTEKQYYAIKRLLFDGIKPVIVAKEMGVTYGTPRFHMDRGIHNIVSKGWKV